MSQYLLLINRSEQRYVYKWNIGLTFLACGPSEPRSVQKNGGTYISLVQTEQARSICSLLYMIKNLVNVRQKLNKGLVRNTRASIRKGGETPIWRTETCVMRTRPGPSSVNCKFWNETRKRYYLRGRRLNPLKHSNCWLNGRFTCSVSHSYLI